MMPPKFKFYPLPPEAERIIKRLKAPPRLYAHLQLVHDSAHRIVHRLEKWYPKLKLDRQTVLMGAALHDLGKVEHPKELSVPGSDHELAGWELLEGLGLDPKIAVIAFTHGAWRRDSALPLEDLLVALADMAWKGVRSSKLDNMVIDRIHERTEAKRYEVFMKLDGLLTRIGDDSEARLEWQGEHPLK